MQSLTKRASVPIVIVLLLLALTGCAVRLLPAYDQSIFDKVNTLNAKALTLFSALSTGATSASFGKYQPQYDELIGGFDATRQAAQARPIPPLGQRLFTMGAWSQLCGKDVTPEDCLNRSPSLLASITALLTTMRQTNQQKGLAADLVVGFKRQYQISMNEILVFEAALQR